MDIPGIKQVREYLVARPGKGFSLASRPTREDVLFPDKEQAETSLKKDAAVINELKDILYAHKKQAVLVVLQGMDTAGKSSTIRAVFADTTPLGMEVKAFKAPSANELARDYLWRVHNAVPKKGHVGIFDRSHYEDVLVAKVRDLATAGDIEQRYDQINAFEKHLTQNGVILIKCMLNIGYEEQGIRLAERLVEPHKKWKFNPGDLDDRRDWAKFMAAYETAIERCSTRHAPWYVVPSDSRTRRNAMIARLVRGALEDLNLDWPDPGYQPGDFDIG